MVVAVVDDRILKIEEIELFTYPGEVSTKPPESVPKTRAKRLAGSRCIRALRYSLGSENVSRGGKIRLCTTVIRPVGRGNSH